MRPFRRSHWSRSYGTKVQSTALDFAATLHVYKAAEPKWLCYLVANKWVNPIKVHPQVRY